MITKKFDLDPGYIKLIKNFNIELIRIEVERFILTDKAIGFTFSYLADQEEFSGLGENRIFLRTDLRERLKSALTDETGRSLLSTITLLKPDKETLKHFSIPKEFSLILLTIDQFPNNDSDKIDLAKKFLQNSVLKVLDKNEIFFHLHGNEPTGKVIFQWNS